MNKQLIKFTKKLLPHLLIIIGFIVITIIYFSPAFEGKELRQMDYEHSRALAKEQKELFNKTGHFSPWTNSVFSGMPGYQIYMPRGIKHNIYYFTQRILRLFDTVPYSTAAIMFVYLIGFYLLMLTLRFNKWISVIFSLAFALSTYNIIIIAVGHITKAYAIGIMPIVLAAFILLYRYQKYLWGLIAVSFALGTQISTTHVQIVYYTGLMVGIYVIYEFIKQWIREKKAKSFIIASSIALLGVIFAIIPNTVALWSTYELTKNTIRGGHSEVKEETEKTKGLDKDYAFSWSYGISETLTLMIPEIKGGESNYIGNDIKVMEKIDSPFKQYIAQSSRYWGPQIFTSGPVYFGSIIIFLFVLGMFIVKDDQKWWLFAATILSIMLAWGKHFMPLSDLFYYYFPLYNKFRVVSMILVIPSVTILVIAAMTVKEITNNPDIIKQKSKYFFISLGLTAGLALLIYLAPKLAGSLLTIQEQENMKSLLTQNPANVSQIKAFFNDLMDVRAMIIKNSAIRSFLFIILSAIIIWTYTLFLKTNKSLFFLLLGFLIIIDLWTVDIKYLSYKDFKSKRITRNVFQPTPADKFILKTNQLNYRVLNLTVDPFNDAMTSYFHKHIGGYSAAKLRRYQDIIDFYLHPYSFTIVNTLRDTTINRDILEVIKPMQVLHMLNTLYIIINPNTMPIINPYTFGNAWFVDAIKFVNTPKEEIDALNYYDLKRVAIINKEKYKHIKFPNLSLKPDTSRYIELVYYQPDSLVYHSYSKNDEFVVFSEIFYPIDWDIYINGEKGEIINTDFILRGTIVPAGEHKIIMVFKPKSIYLGRKIALFGTLLVIGLLILAIGWEVFKLNKTQKQQENET